MNFKRKFAGILRIHEMMDIFAFVSPLFFDHAGSGDCLVGNVNRRAFVPRAFNRQLPFFAFRVSAGGIGISICIDEKIFPALIFQILGGAVDNIPFGNPGKIYSADEEYFVQSYFQIGGQIFLLAFYRF